VIGAAANVLSDWYTHSELNALFDSDSFPGDVPQGANKLEKCRQWLRRGNTLPDPLTSFGQLIAEMMDFEIEPPRPNWDGTPVEVLPDKRDRLRSALTKEGLSYARGGYIHGANMPGPSLSLREQLRLNPFKTIEVEFNRATASVESDPPAAVTAACAILEALCKNYLNVEEQEGPNKQLLGRLFPTVMKDLNLSPADYVGDMQQIITGMFAATHGVAALRTHVGSAHGHDDNTWPIYPRHARLAVNAAHTLTVFILETWQAQKG
jgi:hypothetical protein